MWLKFFVQTEPFKARFVLKTEVRDFSVKNEQARLIKGLLYGFIWTESFFFFSRLYCFAWTGFHSCSFCQLKIYSLKSGRLHKRKPSVLFLTYIRTMVFCFVFFVLKNVWCFLHEVCLDTFICNITPDESWSITWK